MGGQRPGRFCRFTVPAAWRTPRGAAQAIHRALNENRNLTFEGWPDDYTWKHRNSEVLQCRKLRPIRRFTATAPQRLVRRVLPSNLTAASPFESPLDHGAQSPATPFKRPLRVSSAGTSAQG
jgi:hypothetical protein